MISIGENVAVLQIVKKTRDLGICFDEELSFARFGGWRSGTNSILVFGRFYSDIHPHPRPPVYVWL